MRATDQVGNVDASPATRNFTVDTVAPTTTIDSGPSGLTNNASPSFGFSSNDGGASFECRLDTGAFGACSSPQAYSGLADGAHSFEVRAKDAAGNTDASPASRAFTVDAVVVDTACQEAKQKVKKAKKKVKKAKKKVKKAKGKKAKKRAKKQLKKAQKKLKKAKAQQRQACS